MTHNGEYDVASEINMTLNIGEESKKLYTTYLPRSDRQFVMSLSFHISGGEVRPNNMAIKLWTRVN